MKVECFIFNSSCIKKIRENNNETDTKAAETNC